MGKIKIVTDSTADLTKEQVEQMGITVVPLNITIGDETYIDGVDFTHNEFLDKMKNSPVLPKSSQPSAGAFAEAFENINDDCEILCILLSEKLSGTCQSAIMAAEMVNANVTVFNSNFVSYGMQIQIIEAYNMIENGCTMSEIIARLEVVREKTKLIVALDTVDNLVKGGRLGKGKALISQLLNIKPIVVVKDGEIKPEDKVRSMSQVIKYHLKQLQDDLHGKTLTYLSVIYVGEIANANILKQEIKKAIPIDIIPEIPATSVLATHAGPGTLAICYLCE